MQYEQLDDKQIDTKIAGIRRSVASVNNNVQQIAVAILVNATRIVNEDTGQINGDVSRVPKLIRALPPKLRPVLKRYFNNVSPCRITIGKTANDDRVSLYKPDHDKYVDWNIDLAKQSMWHDDPFATPADNDEELRDFAWYYDQTEKFLNRMANDTKADAGKIKADDIAKVQALRTVLRTAFTSLNDGIAPDVQDKLDQWNEEARKAA